MRGIPFASEWDRPHQTAFAHQSSAGFAGAEHMGTGTFVSPGRAVADVTAGANGQGFELNLVNAPIAAA
jgi:hypothetical protein